MEKEFVHYGLAVELIELGFNEPCFGYWFVDIENKSKITYPQTRFSKWYTGKEILAPLYQQVFRWFREKYGIPSHIATYWQHDWNDYSYQYYFVENKKEWNGIEHYTTYKEAELACLRRLIDMAKEIIVKDL